MRRTTHSDIEILAAVAEAGLPAEIEVIYVAAWGDHPLAVQAMVAKIAACQ